MQALGLLVGVGRADPDADHEVGLFQLGRRAEAAAIDLDGLHQLFGREVGGEGVGQAKRRGQLRAVGAGSQQPQRHVLAFARNRAHRLVGRSRLEPVLKLDHILGEAVDRARIAAQSADRGLVSARRTAQAQVDSAWMKRGKRAESLGDHQRRMVGQHDPAGSDSNFRGAGGHVTNNHGCGGAGDTGHVVMLGQPISVET